ncbi:MAG: hypothetical protein NTV61_02170 [Candidatus Bathyarchaeota archaeon]|nr:hypothetical protein [Candidatus Bathyarchaeota archaeon]
MEKWVLIALIVVLLVGSGGGYFFASSTYKPQVDSLQTQLTSTQQELSTKSQSYDKLNGEYQALTAAKAKLDADYVSLQAKYDSLDASYATVSSQYDVLKESSDSGFVKLSADYVTLKNQYDALNQMVGSDVYKTIGYTQMLQNYYQLTLNVRTLNATLWAYCDEPYSFRNTLTTSDVMKVESAVIEAIGSSTNAWSCYQKIHEYVTSNIKYVYDIEFPSIGQYTYTDVNGVRYLTGFDTGTITNYIQKPEFTLQYKQGDCDDQAALEYAMVRYYNKYILGSDYNLYIAEMKFSDGSGHISVFMPVSGGKITILDPAGNYLTSTSSTITL